MATKTNGHRGLAWGKVYAEQQTNPAWLALPPTAQALWFNGLLECLAKESDGLLRTSALALRLHPGDTERDAALLVAEGWWEHHPEGYRMREWGRWQRTRAEVERARNRGRAAGRKGGRQKAANTRDV